MSKEIQRMVDVMQAYLDGEEVEWRRVYGGDWFLCNELEMFQWDKYDFRIKPKPREVWIRDGGLFYSKEESEKYGDVAVKYREVIEDE